MTIPLEWENGDVDVDVEVEVVVVGKVGVRCCRCFTGHACRSLSPTAKSRWSVGVRTSFDESSLNAIREPERCARRAAMAMGGSRVLLDVQPEQRDPE